MLGRTNTISPAGGGTEFKWQEGIVNEDMKEITVSISGVAEDVGASICLVGFDHDETGSLSTVVICPAGTYEWYIPGGDPRDAGIFIQDVNWDENYMRLNYESLPSEPIVVSARYFLLPAFL